MSARDIADPTLSRPRKPERTVPFGFPPVGRVIRAMVQSRSDWVTAAVMPTNSVQSIGEQQPGHDRQDLGFQSGFVAGIGH